MSESEKRSFFDLPPTERHRRLLNYHESQNPPNSKGNHQLTSDNVGFFSKDEEKEISNAHKFLRSEDDDVSVSDSWATRLAKKYYGRLFKEYCIVDLSLYEYGCLGTRWRTKEEVLEGKGQFICAAKQCNETNELHTYEVNFSYTEDGQKKQALVKVRLCPSCMRKMNFRRTVLKEKVSRVLQKKAKRKRSSRSINGKKRSKTQNQKEKGDGGDDSDGMEECLDDLLL